MASSELKRELGVAGAVLIGLGSILGTGVFVVIALGVEMTGLYVLAAILVAALVATCNGLNSAQLAANYPVAGGTYEYGYRLLTPALGFTAGWMFLLAKSASAATAALAIARRFADVPWQIPVALGVIVLMTAVILGGLRRTSLVNLVIVSLTLLALLAFVLGGVRMAAPGTTPAGGDVFSFFEVCALIFVGYTGYGRIATMGGEIRDPRKNIPLAMFLTLGASALLYLGVAWAQLRGAPYPALWRVGEVTALLGVLLNLVLGLSRILYAMGLRGDMPGRFGRVGAAGQPAAAVVGVAVLICMLVGLGDIKLAWSFSTFTVLVYYSICNLAALRLRPEQTLYPRLIGYAGLASCVFLAFWVDWRAWSSGLVLIGLGLLWHRWRRVSATS
ncbi:APC family permease [Ruficoccus amylovorans]|uniref:APC family permease n=1 Tax=Ruficoccus amylovorans TaxID=1804625 RepID=A0A842HHP8_9BACT|nr:APC family permease [Ruficoccus amylovorans]MBC2596053.1 APC family permease [Ruficoccus amylovorans]